MYLAKINFNHSWLTDLNQITGIPLESLTNGAVIELWDLWVDGKENLSLSFLQILKAIVGSDLNISEERLKEKVIIANKNKMKQKNGGPRNKFMMTAFFKKKPEKIIRSEDSFLQEIQELKRALDSANSVKNRLSDELVATQNASSAVIKKVNEEGNEFQLQTSAKMLCLEVRNKALEEINDELNNHIHVLSFENKTLSSDLQSACFQNKKTQVEIQNYKQDLFDSKRKYIIATKKIAQKSQNDK